MDKGILFKKESYRIIGACFEVYKEKGCGFLESVYQECLELELVNQEIPFKAKPLLALRYKGTQLEQKYQPDLICFEEIIVEIKAVKQLHEKHRVQVINYLKATGKKLGLLINFGHYPKIEHERFINA